MGIRRNDHHALAEVDATETAPANEAEERSFDEAVALYEREWVLMKVTAFDQFHQPERGIVLAHSSDRGAVSEVLKKEPPRRPDAPYQPYYVFNAFPRMHPDETFDEAAARIAAQRAAAEDIRRARRRT